MNRRRFLKATATASAIGLLAGCSSGDPTETDESDEGGGESTTDESTPTETTTPTDTATPTPDDSATTEPNTSDTESWASGGVIDGVEFEFSGDGAECADSEMSEIDATDIEFDTDAGEVVVTGTISGSDLCKRARLANLVYDREQSHLTVAIEAVDREDVDACAQCIAEIAYEGRFSFAEEIPESASVSHDGQGIASAAHGSASAGPPSETTDETTAS